MNDDWRDIPNRWAWLTYLGAVAGVFACAASAGHWPALLAFSAPAALGLFAVGLRHGLWDSRE